MRVEWTEDLATGVETIDAQHREIIAMANRLRDAAEGGAGQEQVAHAVAFLEEYVRNHFAMEETYMKRLVYPDYPGHKGEHTAFINDFYDFQQSLDDQGATPALATALADRLNDWLLNHIGRRDKALGAFLRGRR